MFEALIGILPTLKSYDTVYETVMFQALIGILRTSEAVNQIASSTVLFQALIGILPTGGIFPSFVLRQPFHPCFLTLPTSTPRAANSPRDRRHSKNSTRLTFSHPQAPPGQVLRRPEDIERNRIRMFVNNRTKLGLQSDEPTPS